MERHYMLVVLLAWCSTPLAGLSCTPPANRSAATASSGNATVTAAEVVSVDVPGGVIVVNAGTQETLVVTNATVFSPVGASLASFEPHAKVLFAYKMEQGRKVATHLIGDAASVRSDPSAPNASSVRPPPTDASTSAPAGTPQPAAPESEPPPPPPTLIAGPGGLTIIAKISNPEAASRCISKESTIQLLRIGVKGEQLSEQGEKPSVRASTATVVLEAKALLSGHYILVVQGWSPMDCPGWLIPALHRGGKAVEFVIPPNATTPFRVDLGVVEMPGG